MSQNTGIFPKLLSVFLFLIDFISESSGKWGGDDFCTEW